jgi:hypothetical protein
MFNAELLPVRATFDGITLGPGLPSDNTTLAASACKTLMLHAQAAAQQQLYSNWQLHWVT